MYHIELGFFLVGEIADRGVEKSKVAMKHFLEPTIFSIYETLKMKDEPF